MRRAVALISLLLLSLGSFASAAPNERTVQVAYQVLEAVIDPPQNLYLHGRGRYKIRVRPGERFVSVAIEEDATGWKVPATVYQDKGDDGITESSHSFCGATEQPVAIKPNIPIWVRLGEGSCSGTDILGYGSYTRGTITATLSQ